MRRSYANSAAARSMLEGARGIIIAFSINIVVSPPVALSLRMMPEMIVRSVGPPSGDSTSR